ncbi:hypothetical protein HMPREF3038_01174 [Akkermansia sp. KLE1797]|nr:hypothetical protein HMPREF3038_01174 [Akkermansia sp. KLE1797]KXU53308.1 hypothetical protein HMPREF3039_02490 [Akkermansia sp. KLE1798]KZA05156.1 hypothetical protein HMPREF1326_01192 [Akkermansia sp. KLE1605]
MKASAIDERAQTAIFSKNHRRTPTGAVSPQSLQLQRIVLSFQKRNTPRCEFTEQSPPRPEFPAAATLPDSITAAR